MINQQTHEIVRNEFLGFGETAIINTVGHMRTIIYESSKNQTIRKWAEKMIDFANEHDEIDEIESIYKFLASHTRYTKDPDGFEYIKTPPVSLAQLEVGERPHLDCDDAVVLPLSLLKSVGYPVGIRVASYKPNKVFTHVYGLVYTKRNGWIPFDLVGKRGFGYEHPSATRIKDILI